MSGTIKPVDVEALKALVRTVPDFPKPGFFSMTSHAAQDKTGFAKLIDALAAHYIERKVDLVLASRRGVHLRTGVGLPAQCRLCAGAQAAQIARPVARVTYDLEYGSDTLEIHQDAIQPGQRVCSSMICWPRRHNGATVKLVKQLGGEIVGLALPWSWTS